MNKFKIGDKVIYDGLVGIIESVPSYPNGSIHYDLVSEEDPELTCSAKHEDCTLYNGEEIDQESRLGLATLENRRIQNMGESLTDKFFRDGNH